VIDLIFLECEEVSDLLNLAMQHPVNSFGQGKSDTGHGNLWQPFQ